MLAILLRAWFQKGAPGIATSIAEFLGEAINSSGGTSKKFLQFGEKNSSKDLRTSNEMKAESNVNTYELNLNLEE